MKSFWTHTISGMKSQCNFWNNDTQITNDWTSWWYKQHLCSILCMSWVPISTWIIGILNEIFQDFLQNSETYLMQCHILESSKLKAVSDSFKSFYKLHAIKSQNLPNNLYSTISSLCHSMLGWNKKLHHTFKINNV
jgi:hypothetical protein